MIKKGRAVLAVIAFFASVVANAMPVEWTIDSLVFDDGGKGSGTFTYDADTNSYSAIEMIVTTAGTDFAGASYTWVVGNSTGLLARVAPLEGLPALELTFAASLTDAGGVIAIVGAGEFRCGPECSYPVSTLRGISSGQISAVPIPAAVWLFGSALAGLGWLRRKQTI
jgi:hypothetical protein